MKKLRKWLVMLMAVSLVVAIALNWIAFCKVEVIVNSVALLACIAVDVI